MKQVLSESTRFRRSERVDETRVGDRVVLFHRDTGTGVVLNPTGSVIWEFLGVPHSADELAATLREKFPATPSERIAADVASYVGSLLDQHLIASHA